MNRISVLAAVAATTMLWPAAARANSLDHRGFMARLGLGFGYTVTSETSGSTTVSASGGAGSVNLALGGYVVPNLALHATIWGGTVFNPSVSVSGSGGTVTGTATDASLLASAFGVGVTYFLSPADVYFSASLGAGDLRFERSRGGLTYTAKTGLGLALNLGVGKQWALGPEWGIGVSGQLGWQSNPDNTTSTTDNSLSTLQLGVLFSITYH